VSQLKTPAETKPKTSAETSARSVRDLYAVAGVLLATLLTYASTFTFGWVYDDPPQIPLNRNLEWNRLGFLFTHQLWASMAGTQSRFYRPLLTLWFLINKTIFGLNPHWFHVTTVLAHVAATALAFCIARTLLKDSASALVATAIFALHPIQVESVSWISSVNDPLAASLCFASFLSYRQATSKQRNSAIWWALAGFLFLLALFTKEVSVVLPGIILIDLWANDLWSNSLSSNSRSQPGKGALSKLPLPAISTYVAVTVLWIGLRSWILGDAAATASPVPLSDSLLSAPKILLFNLYRAVLPIGLSPQYDFHLVESADSAQFLFALLALIALASLAIMAAKREPKLWVGLAWLVLPVLPTLNLRWMNEDDFVHDRYMYMSMLGVALLAASGYAWIRRQWPRQQLVRPLATCVALVLAFASAVQSQYWANDVILFSRAVGRAPQNEWAQLNYGSALSARGKFADAAPRFVSSYQLKPGWRAAAYAGFAYQQSGDLGQADQWFQAALQFNPSLGSAWLGLGQIRLAQHLPNEAIRDLKKALEVEPTADGFHYELGAALEQTGQTSAAMEEYKTELQLHPYQTEARKAFDRLHGTPSDR
jgi:protein O-mannosyl-transferase